MLKKTLLALCLAVSTAFSSYAADPALASTIEAIQSKCPVTYADGWSMQSASYTDDVVTMQFRVNIPADYFAMMKQNSATIKPMWIANMASAGEGWKSIAKAVSAAGASLVVQMSTTDDPEGFSISFTPTELASMM